MAARAVLSYWRTLGSRERPGYVTHYGFGIIRDPGDEVVFQWEDTCFDALKKMTLESGPANLFYSGFRRQEHKLHTRRVRTMDQEYESFIPCSVNVVANKALERDTLKLTISYAAMFLYAWFMLSSCRNCSRSNRFYLTILGILTVPMGLLIGGSLTTLAGMTYTTIHLAIPYLCLGELA